MKILKNIALVAGNTFRTRAYLQILCREEMKPAVCLFFDEDSRYTVANSLSFSEADFQYFNPEEEILTTLQKNDIPYVHLNTRDIHSAEMLNKIATLEQRYLIYSGYGGVILKPELFRMGKEIIHVHAGDLPAYRGSTTAYYSILKEGCISATSIFMNEELDQGDLLLSERFPLPPKETNIDVVYEPYTRAVVLADTLKAYLENNECFRTKKQDGYAETYFIIHPLLKHIAMMRLQ